MTAAQREACIQVVVRACEFTAAVHAEAHERGSSADRIDAWEDLKDAMEKLEETEG